MHIDKFFEVRLPILFLEIRENVYFMQCKQGIVYMYVNRVCSWCRPSV